MHKYTAAPGILVWRVLRTLWRDFVASLTRRIQAIVDKAVGFGEPGDQVLVMDIIDQNVQVLVTFEP